VIKSEEGARQYKISVSYMEIYNECVNDLMNPANKNLEIRESVDGILINRLTEKEVDTPQVVMAIME